MNNTNEINNFLNYFSRLYLQNPRLEIRYETIYSHLKIFNYSDNVYNPVVPFNIDNVRANIDNRYWLDNRVNTFYTFSGSFWVIENRKNLNDKEFYEAVDNSVKLYISIDENCIEKVAKQLFDFMINNNIVNQSKISEFLRVDALVLRVEKMEDAKKIINFVNNLDYSSKYKPNPFLYHQGKVAVAKDGRLSYNGTVSKILELYFKNKKYTNTLEKANYEDFKEFVNKYDFKSSNNYKIFELNNEIEYNDYLMIIDILKNNLNNTTNLEFINNLIPNESKKLTTHSVNVLKDNIILDIINRMSNFYTLDECYAIFNKYIETGNVNYFTRKNDIRNLVSSNFNNKTFEQELDNCIWNILLKAFSVTYNKYGNVQAQEALNNAFINNDYTSFTRDEGVRNDLTQNITTDFLRKVAIKKCVENGLTYNMVSIYQIVINESNILIDIKEQTNKK